MKAFLLLPIMLLCGCAATDYTKIPLGTANITKLSQSISKKQVLSVEFDYKIKNFNDTNNIYQCAINYITKGGGSLSISRGKPCKIKQEAGTVKLNWKLPLTKKGEFTMAYLDKILNKPLEYRVTVLQQVRKDSSNIIGQSDIVRIN